MKEENATRIVWVEEQWEAAVAQFKERQAANQDAGDNNQDKNKKARFAKQKKDLNSRQRLLGLR